MRQHLIILLFILTWNVNSTAQCKTDKAVRLKFEEIEVKQFNPSSSQKEGSFDFKIVDAQYFEEHTKEQDITNTENFKSDFELATWDSKTIEFQCTDRIKETCFTYLGYSENMEGHLIGKCKDICATYLMDATNGNTVVLPSNFDGGSTPIFSYEYMIVYSSYYDDSFEEYYDYRATIDVYKILDAKKPIEDRFEYVGSFNSRNWSIAEIVFHTDKENAFIIKLYDTDNEFDYVEMEF